MATICHYKCKKYTKKAKFLVIPWFKMTIW